MSRITSKRTSERSLEGVSRFVYELSEPVRFSHRDDVPYRDGESTTTTVVVSWGRMGDTGIFPANAQGLIEDLGGFRMDYSSHRDPDEFMAEWLHFLEVAA